jgi:hypothetical protein
VHLRQTVRDVAVIATAHAIACALVRVAGFDHVSDDDFARVTIAQAFAASPRLDPSGTSWLPFPFWVLGASLRAFGRSLAAARAASVALASLAVTTPYLALRGAGVPRGRALVALAFAVLSPWSLWLGAATVPESITASLATAGAIALGAPSTTLPSRPWARAPFVAALGAACLSRYETWPVAAVLAIVLAWRSARGDRRGLALAAAATIGPLAWMAWNLHAHGSAVHFFHRVANYKRAIGEGSTDTVAALLLYPRLFVTMRPDVTIAAAFGALLLRAPAVRARWLVPFGCAIAQIAFLAYGNARDGAPAHHAERALLGTTMLLAIFGVEALASTPLRAFGATRDRAALLVFGLVGAAWLYDLRRLASSPPGSGDADDRRAQVRRGLELRGAPRLVVTPCAFEHFALIAAFEAPERVEVLPKTGAPVDPSCPRVDTR